MSRDGYIYFVECGTSGRIKIGWALNPEARIKNLQTGSSTDLKILAAEPGTVKQEKLLHHRFSDHLWRGEWFRPHSRLLAYIDKVLKAHGPSPWSNKAAPPVVNSAPLGGYNEFGDEQFRRLCRETFSDLPSLRSGANSGRQV